MIKIKLFGYLSNCTFSNLTQIITTKTIKFVIVPVFAAFLFLSVIDNAQAATFTVTKTADTNDDACDADCSLREAIVAANNSALNDTVVFSSLFNSAQTINLSGSELIIANNGSLSISGSGAELLTISGNNQSRVFLINTDANANINGITITGGRVTNGDGGGINNFGGTLTINNSIISGNAIGNQSGGSNDEGGGIFNFGALSINNSTISGNSAGGRGGGISNGISGSTSTLNITNSTVSGNVSNDNGGGIHNNSVLNLTNTTVSNNRAKGNVGFGGGILSYSVATLTNSTVSNNTADQRGGGIYAVGSLTVSNSIVSGNIAGNGGGGIDIGDGCTLNINSSTISGNRADINGSTVFYSGGGGVRTDRGTINLNNSTISGNQAINGGGIHGDSINTFINVNNSTISNNTASSNGGGIFNGSSSVTTLIFSTVNSNTADIGGGIFNENFTTVNGSGSIIADNIARGTAPDFRGRLTSQGYNLIESTTGTIITGSTTGNILGRDPQLLPLRNNGGITQTASLQPTSPAIDAAAPNNFPSTDQRGVIRPQDGDLNASELPDIGAYERQVAIFVVTKTADTNDSICNADCSLREAIATVNAATSTSDKAILFNSGLFATAQTITLTDGELVLNNSGTLIINGQGADLLTISGNNQSRVFSNNINSTATIKGLTVSGGNGVGEFNNDFGGGVYNAGRLTIVDSNISGNRAANGGGFSSTQGIAFIINSTLANNVGNLNGGGIFNGQSSALTIDNSLVQNNSSVSTGGINNRGSLNIINSTINGNSTGSAGGGGITNFDTGTAIITNTTISNNKVTQNFVHAGGIFNFGAMSLTGCAISGNSTSLSGAGGGIFNSRSLTITNSTISRNFATSGGGGISNGGILDLINSTISYNSVGNDSGDGGGGIRNAGGTVNTRNTIIANNITNNGNSPDFQGTLSSLGYNLIKNTSGTTIVGITTGNKLNVDPLLDPVLRNNGGATRTHSLRLNSPAIDAGIAVQNLIADQRGRPRPFDFPLIPNAPNGNGSDIGSFERQNTDITLGVTFDYDGDGKADISVYRPSSSGWYINRSSDNSFFGTIFGVSEDIITPADYDGDGKTDVSVFRPSLGSWYRINSSNNQFFGTQFGSTGDIPVPADFDGDGRADIAVFRPSNGTWYWLNSSNNQFVGAQFGTNGDIPQIGDFDGDGKADLAVFRPSNNAWHILRSADNSFYGIVFGSNRDIPTTADYDGDGRTDIAVYRPSTGFWYRLNSSNNQFFGEQFGISEDRPAAADYDGDGRADLAVFRPSNGAWYVNRSTAGFAGQRFGAGGDIPTPAALGR